MVLKNDFKIKVSECNTCTRRLVQLANQRSFWFKFLREPLKFYLRTWVYISGININPYILKNENCINCNRIYKNALKDNSILFNKVNNLINPIFDKYIENLVNDEEIKKSKEYAKSAYSGNQIPIEWKEKLTFNKWKKI